MGWLRLVGSLNYRSLQQKSPAKETYILKKRPIILRSLLIEATPYFYVCSEEFVGVQRENYTNCSHPTPYITVPIIMNTKCTQMVSTESLYVSFAKEPYERDDILQRRPTILRSLLIVATPPHTSLCLYHEY